MRKKQKIMLARILISAAMLIGLHFVPAEGWLKLALYMIPYLVIGYDILIKAFKGVKNRQVFDESFLMAVATVGAVALALYEKSGDYTEAIAVMLFYQVGEWFQSYAVGKAAGTSARSWISVPITPILSGTEGWSRWIPTRWSREA